MKATTITLECLELNRQGKGIVLYKQKKYPIDNLLPGEKGQFTFKNNQLQLMKITEPSKHRVSPRCNVYHQCGGCHLLHMDDTLKRDFKTKITKETFTPLKSMMDCTIEPCEMAEDGYYYRNKVQMPITTNKKRQIVIGFYKENTIDIIENDDCFIQTPMAKKVLHTLRAFIKQYHLSAYDWNTKRGLLKYVLIRYGMTTGELMVVLITNGRDFKFKKQFVSTMTKAIPEIKAIIQNVNLRKDHLVLDREEHIWYGKGYILDYIGDVKFLISSKSFYQINPPQVKKMYDCIANYANLTGKETVIDAYCGVGTIGLYLAKKAKAVYGVEMIVSAIDDAKKNARLNNINNAHFKVGDASDYMVQLSKSKAHVDVVIVDPPRSGCTPELMKSVLMLQPNKFIYVSCNIETQVRDLKQLQKSGYRIKKMQAFDLFPQTHHVECIALLQRRK